ncbi:ComEC/Rec2 family competence protein [Micrococcus terreus]|uniref:ComEC/Rec2 family competence protein n=1 Tax=Micrococcus terreus TaxID=574650 RepID=UPI0034008CC0
MSAADGPAATGRLPLPVDVRLVPSVLLTLACALWAPVAPWGAVRQLPLVLMVAAGLCTATVLVVRHRERHLWTGLQTMLAMMSVALWIGSIVSVQAIAHREESRALGWEQSVTAEATVLVEGMAAGPAVYAPGRFADRWYVPAEVESFGHPGAAAPRETQVQAAGDVSWSSVAPGDRLCFTADLEGAGATVFARVRTVPDTGRCGPGRSDVHGQTGRDHLREGLRQAAAGTVARAPELLPGLILGDRSVQSPELDTAMKDSGLSHLSAVSGANCTLLAGAVTMALRTLRVRRPVVLAAVLGTLVMFVIVVGLEPSVIRAAVMGGIGAAALFFGRGRQALPLLCVAVCVLLCWQPGLATEAAFQLSVCATAGIVLGARPVEQWLTAVLSRWLPGPVAGVLSAALAVTVCAQIACQPVLLGLSGSISAYAVPANLLAAPLVPFVTVPGTVAAALVPLLPGVAELILWWVAWPAAGIGWIATTVSAWPGALHPWPEGLVGGALIGVHLLSSLALLWLLLRWERVRPARVRRTGRGRRTPEPRRVLWATRACWAVIAAGIGSQAAILVPPPVGAVPADWALAVCDVGQGDMLVLRSGARSAVVVDTGPEPGPASACLDELDVGQVDLLVLTHLHQDHVGGTVAVLDCCPPARTIYSTSQRPVSTHGEDTASRQAPAEAELVSAGEQGHHGQQGWAVDWTVLAADHAARSENDASVVLHAVLTAPQGRFTVLLTGDLEEQAAANLVRAGGLPESVDVLKASHHGARNGGLDIAETVHPLASVISVGADNDYGHPHSQITGALSRYGPVVRTDHHGTFVFSVRDGILEPTVRPRRSAPASR